MQNKSLLSISLARVVAGIFCAWLLCVLNTQAESAKVRNIDTLTQELHTVVVQLKQYMDERALFYKNTHNRIRALLEQETFSNLSDLRANVSTEIGYDVDIYLINNELVITQTTFDPDLGLDFKSPVFIDAQVIFQLADRMGETVVGMPTQEIVTGQYKIYSVSALADGGYLEIGFSDPAIGDYISNMTTRLLAMQGITGADLFIDHWGSQLSFFTRIPALENLGTDHVDKANFIDAISALMAREYEIIKGVTPEQPVYRAVDVNTGDGVLYLDVGSLPLTDDHVFRFIAKLRLKTTIVDGVL